jgi:pyrrolysine biosynthesis protein PylD
LSSRGKPLTRLKSSDIISISSQLKTYNENLLLKTGRNLLGIACYSCNVEEAVIVDLLKSFSFYVVPVTAGQGIISDFSETVCAILRFLGCEAEVATKNDAVGVAQAFAQGADAIFMADDHKFIGLNLHTRSVIDNSEATGAIYGAVLDLMTGGLQGHDVLVLGCGPVGEAVASKLLSFGARVILYDINIRTAQKIKTKLLARGNISVVKSINDPEIVCQYIVDATPVKNAILNDMLSDNTYIVAPGVPLGVSRKSYTILKNRIIHDKLELGVSAMAVALLN